MAAAQEGDVELATLLLQMGTDASIGGDDGRTALDLARERGHQQVVDLLATWS